MKYFTQEEIQAEKARRWYKSYVELVHRGVWLHGKAVDYLCDKVQEFVTKKTANAYDILIISLPPQHGKSLTITETLPSWWLGKNPKGRVIEISYSEEFAKQFGRRNRAKVEDFGYIFGIQLAKVPDSVVEFELSNNIGGMISRGIMSGVTGKPADLMIIDDPIKNREEADSETRRSRIWEEWTSSFKTRLAAGSKVILIQTRWHEDDLAGRMIQQERNVEVINLPCAAEENDPLGRAVGASLCPEIGKDDAWLASYRQSYLTTDGTRAWNALFQGRPSSMEGNLLKREWWNYYKELPKMILTIISVDAAFKDGDKNDYVSIQAWGKRQSKMYLLDRVKKHLDFPHTLQAIKTMAAKYPSAYAIYVEDKANGSAIISMLRQQITTMAIIAVEPQGGKIARVNAVSPAIESGCVYLPLDAEFTGEFVDECASFPNGKHDDDVDAMSQALNKLIPMSGELGRVPILDEYERSRFGNYLTDDDLDEESMLANYRLNISL